MSTADYVEIDEGAHVAKLRYSLTLSFNYFIRKAVWLENKQDILKDISPVRLVVYLNKEAYNRKDPSRPGLQLPANIGISDDDAVWILVPTLINQSGIIYFPVNVANDSRQAGLQQQFDDAVQKAVEKLTIKVLIPVDPTIKDRPRPKRAISLRKKVLKKVAQAAE